MNFISPRTDFAFKKIFGSATSKNVCISFLNAILGFKDTENEIEYLDILDPWVAPKIEGLKDTYLDVKVKTKCQKEIIIEMQVLNVEGFEKRILYNTAKTYANQIQKGQSYLDLNPVIALTIVDFEMFQKEESVDYINTFKLKEKTKDFEYNGDFELVFVELPKFQKKLEELDNIQDKWIYFLKEVDNLDVIPDSFKNDTSFDEAFYIAETSHISAEELDILERKGIFIADIKNAQLKTERLAKEQLEKAKEQLLQLEKVKEQLGELEKEKGQLEKENGQLEKENDQLEKEKEQAGKEGIEKCLQEALKKMIDAGMNEQEAKRILGVD